MPELPRYRSHKVVRAARILVVDEWHDGGSAMLTVSVGGTRVGVGTQRDWRDRFKPSAGDLGYYILYEDGYESWSPSKAFEDGYTLL